jgi:predicted amidohydrolase
MAMDTRKAAQEFKAALIQLRVVGGRREINLTHAIESVTRAAGAGAALAVLPEAMNLGWSDESALTQADEIPDGQSCTMLRDTALRLGIYICAGLVEKEGDHVFNAAVLIDRRGEIILRHRKIYELEMAQGLYAPGDRLSVAQTEFGTIGLMICADAFARGQAISRTLGYMGAQIILSPSSWAVPAEHDNIKEPYGQLWLDNYQPVARDFRLWILGVSNVGWIASGAWRGRKCIGCSLVINPAGEPALRGPYGVNADATLYVDVQAEARSIRGDGWEKCWAESRSAAT